MLYLFDVKVSRKKSNKKYIIFRTDKKEDEMDRIKNEVIFIPFPFFQLTS